MNEKKKISLKSIGVDKLVLIAVAGVILILCSVSDSGKESEESTIADNLGSETTQSAENTISTEDELEEILSKINGVGNVSVMITYSSTEEEVLKEDKSSESDSTSEEDSGGGTRTITSSSSSVTTIYTTDENGNDVPYVVKTLLPEVEGVAVVAEGGGNMEVKEEIIGIIQALFNIESHKIWVTEMNQGE